MSKKGVPVKVWRKIEEFTERQYAGSISLNFKDGELLSFDAKEHGTCPPGQFKLMEVPKENIEWREEDD